MGQIIIHKMFSRPSLKKKWGKMYLLSVCKYCKQTCKCRISIHQHNFRGESAPFQKNVKVTGFGPDVSHQSETLKVA